MTWKVIKRNVWKLRSFLNDYSNFMAPSIPTQMGVFVFEDSYILAKAR